MAKTYSGKKVIGILQRFFGFYFVSQKGSHVKLERTISGKKAVTIVPTRKELAPGTLKAVLKLAEISEKDFKKHK